MIKLNDFIKYSKSKGLSTSLINDISNHQMDSFMRSAHILEERSLNMTLMSVFDRLLRDRILWVSGVVDQDMCDVLQAQLMYLDSVENKDITLHINSVGGSVSSGLGIIDVMNYIKSDIVTINTGMAASMGAVLLSSGTKGKRSSLTFSRVMIHHVSSSTQGVVDDQRISLKESEKYNYILMKMLAENCGKTPDEILELSRRDKWFNSKEALEYGIIDEIIGNTSIDHYMEGFDNYYSKEVVGK